MPRYSEVQREQIRSETRSRLLKAAAVEFARFGYSKANIDNISKAAGYAKGTVYNYFSSKRELMLVLIKDIAQLHLDYIAGQVYQKENAQDRLVKFFEAGFYFVSTNFTHGIVMINNLYGPDSEFKQAMYEAYQPMFRLVSQDIVALGIKQGDYREVEPASTAGLLMSIYLGTASQVDESGKLWLKPNQVSDFVSHALRKPTP